MKGITEHGGIFGIEVEDEERHTFRCDGEGCGVESIVVLDEVEANEYIIWAGWKINRETDRDYCPECSTKVHALRSPVPARPPNRIPVTYRGKLPDGEPKDHVSIYEVAVNIPDALFANSKELRAIAESIVELCPVEALEKYLWDPEPGGWSSQCWHSRVRDLGQLIGEILQIDLPE